VDAPEGRQWPSDTDQILKDGWMDSDEALEQARAAVSGSERENSGGELQQFELSSRANQAATGVIRPPFRDGMFVVDTAWRIVFSESHATGRKIARVTVPAYGGAPTIDVHDHDRQGWPARP
jgi:hypothetical protein